jgi:hypothetical protein
MNHIDSMRRTACLLALAAVATTTAHAGPGASQRLAYNEYISVDGKPTGYKSSGWVDVQNATAPAALARIVVAQASALPLNGTAQPVILRRSFPAGDAGATGKSDVLFSIQPSRNAQRDAQNQNTISCRDPNPAPAQFVLGKVVLAAGQSVTATFSGGITWTYQVRDPDAPVTR